MRHIVSLPNLGLIVKTTIDVNVRRFALDDRAMRHHGLKRGIVLVASHATLKTLQAHDPGSAEAALGGSFEAPVRADRLEQGKPFGYCARSAAVGRLTIASFDISNARIFRRSGDLFLLSLPLAGIFQYRKGDNRLPIDCRKHIVAARPGQTYSLDCEHGRAIALSIPAEDLLACAERLTQSEQSQDLLCRPVDSIPLNNPFANALARKMRTTIGDLAELAAIGFGSLARSTCQDLLLNIAVPALFPEIASAINNEPEDCGPRVVRRARDYIFEHADEPIDLAKLASDLGVSIRTMQDNFRRHFGMSARAYIQECRLDRAHMRLNELASGSSVTAIAFDSGFSDLSAFAAKYREKYGELPSETLRVARERM